MNTIDLRCISFEKSKDLILIEKKRTIINTEKNLLDYINMFGKLSGKNNFLFVGPMKSGKTYNKDLIAAKYHSKERCQINLTKDKLNFNIEELIRYRMIEIEGIENMQFSNLCYLAAILKHVKDLYSLPVPQIVATYLAPSADGVVKNIPEVFKWFNVITCSLRNDIMKQNFID